jgi:hypothetical protein
MQRIVFLQYVKNNLLIMKNNYCYRYNAEKNFAAGADAVAVSPRF